MLRQGIIIAAASLGLAGCVVAPARPYYPGPQAYYAPPPVYVVPPPPAPRPWYYGRPYGYGGQGYGGYGRGGYRY